MSRYSASWSHTIGAYKCIFYLNDSRSLKHAYDGRVFPHRVKYGPLLFGCSCRDCHRSLVCTDSTAISMFFDPTLQVPDDERTGRVKARVQDKLTNPFNADKERKKREKEEKNESDKPDKPVWAPIIEREEGVLEDSFAGMAKKTTTRRRLLVSPPPPVSQHHHSDAEVSRTVPRRGRSSMPRRGRRSMPRRGRRSIPRRGRRSTRRRPATRCRGTSTPCASRHPADTIRDLIVGQDADAAARFLGPRRARHSPCRRSSWRSFKTIEIDLVAPARRRTARRRRRRTRKRR